MSRKILNENDWLRLLQDVVDAGVAYRQRKAKETDMDMKTFENKLPESGIEKRFKIEVIADSSGVWAGNGMRYATKEEAVAAAKDLMGRWMLVREWRVLEFKFNPLTDAESWQNEVARS